MSDTPVPCEWHGSPLSEGTPCPACMSEFPSRPVPTDPNERAAELGRLMEAPLSVPFAMMHERIDLLVGRPTFTHELAYPEYLAHEIRTGVRPSLSGIVAKFPHDKPVMVVRDDREVSDG